MVRSKLLAKYHPYSFQWTSTLKWLLAHFEGFKPVLITEPGLRKCNFSTHLRWHLQDVRADDWSNLLDFVVVFFHSTEWMETSECSQDWITAVPVRTQLYFYNSRESVRTVLKVAKSIPTNQITKSGTVILFSVCTVLNLCLFFASQITWNVWCDYVPCTGTPIFEETNKLTGDGVWENWNAKSTRTEAHLVWTLTYSNQYDGRQEIRYNDMALWVPTSIEATCDLVNLLF